MVLRKVEMAWSATIPTNRRYRQEEDGLLPELFIVQPIKTIFRQSNIS